MKVPRLYRTCLVAYPRSYLAEHEDEIMATLEGDHPEQAVSRRVIARESAALVVGGLRQRSSSRAVRALRWTFRGAAAFALVAGGVLLAVHPSASYQPTSGGPGFNPVGIASCASPFNRLTSNTPAWNGPLPYQVSQYLHACNAPTTGREHIVEALGAGAILLVGLSFLPRRRALATKRRLEPSPV